jgi:diguanylate cyclase (GGDEF)-like protein
MAMERSRITASIAVFLALFRVQTDRPNLMQAQVKALSRQVPLLFFIGIVNTLAVAYTHYGVAPAVLTIGCPILITIACCARGWAWAKAGHRTVSDAEAASRLKMITYVGPIGAAIIVVWGLTLYQYGDPYAQGHVVFFMGVTIISSSFCLIQLRPAALLIVGSTAIPFALFFFAAGRPVYIAIALSMLLVSAAMIYIVIIFSRDFANMINIHKELTATQVVIERLANLDSLTDLPNRRSFLAKVGELLDRPEETRHRFIVGLIDLDGFKSVNDLYGHVAGNNVLVEAARRMLEMSDDALFFARLGGDEFGVIIDAALDDDETKALGVRICKALQVPFTNMNIVVDLSGSLGLAAFPQAGSTAELLFERADYALYHAKQHQRGCPVIFSIEHETEIRQFANLEWCLRHADVESEISLYFQPIVDVERGKIVAFEALARWDSPKLGRVAPDIFIRVAERSDLINKLTRMLLRKALAKAKTWPDDIRVSFNLSTRDLGSREAIVNIAAIIENSGVAASRIDLEVTETALIQDFDQASASLRTLRALGVGVSLDDFGAGYSSLSYLQRFPIDKIKIDRSFVKDVETEPSCRAIVKLVIDLCRDLKLTCIVEGMETADQVKLLRTLGCKTMQGYLFGKPMPAAEVLGFINAANLPLRLEAAEVQALAS